MKKINAIMLTLFSITPFQCSYAAEAPKEASKFTKETNDALLKELPFQDKQSFKDAERGFIAPLPDDGIIKNAKGEKIWDLGEFSFIKQGEKAPDTVNPSLWRQAQLILMGGLFKVTDEIYQVRAADLSNITFIEGKDGLVVVDPLISTETAKAALDLYYAHRPKKPIVAVIYTHSHVDHYGGVRGIVSEEDVNSGKVQIVAPEGFLKHAVAENVIAGNAMSRRASYMYGNLLPKAPKGQVGAGLGPTTSFGTVSLIPPTDIIRKNNEKLSLAGLEFVFYLAPDSEAPSEMFFYIPKYKALCTAEDATHTLHNTYSLRGAKIRDPLAWSKYLNEALHLWGNKAVVMFAPHHWPIWGEKNIAKHLELQRDLYRFINDQAVRLLNEGYTKEQIAEMVKLPDSLSQYWSNHGYYGTMSHNLKATFVKYLGWFDGNPATLNILPQVEGSKKYVEYMGGAKAIMAKARKDFAAGNYRWVAEVLNKVVFADPKNQDARNLEADALEQLGYQAESGPWRNFYLSGAKELREGIKKLGTPSTASPDTVRAMDADLLFDYIAIRLNPEKAKGKTITLNFDITDKKKKYNLELINSALSHSNGESLKKADATVSLSRKTLNSILLKEKTLKEAIDQGDIKIQGDSKKLHELLSTLDTFDFWFNIITPNPVK